MTTPSQLHRVRKDAILGGVSAGLSDYFAVDPTIIRLAWVLTAFLGGAGLLAYFVAWLILPDEDGHHTLMPLVLIAVVVVLPIVLGLLVLIPFASVRG